MSEGQDLMPEVIKERVRSQFGVATDQYVHSHTHAHGADLQVLVAYVDPKPSDCVLDIATGGGHTALALAPYVHQVLAIDLTPAMLHAAERFIRSRGVTNVSFELADAEALPFAAATFDKVTTRIAPHHFVSVQRYLQEVTRVLKPDGVFVLEDNVAPDDPEIGAFLNKIERQRDPSHVRSYTVAEWLEFIAEAGLTVERYELGRRPHDFNEWTMLRNMRPPVKHALEHMMLTATPAQRASLQIESENNHVLSWTSTYLILRATKH
jgi:ubiquinone/menaquinone biosynthesis C-methylase UbiE